MVAHRARGNGKQLLAWVNKHLGLAEPTTGSDIGDTVAARKAAQQKRRKQLRARLLSKSRAHKNGNSKTS